MSRSLATDSSRNHLASSAQRFVADDIIAADFNLHPILIHDRNDLEEWLFPSLVQTIVAIPDARQLFALLGQAMTAAEDADHRQSVLSLETTILEITSSNNGQLG